MKDKSFILRSSRITSKTFSTITPTFVQASSHKSSPNEFYSSIDSGHNTISHQQLKSQLSQKDQELKQRLVMLTSNLKNIEKQYKDNLKDGFQNKIKSYRLQAVVQRKMLKQTIEETIRLNEMQDIKEKYQMALKRKQFAQYKAFKQQQMRLKNIEKLKNRSLQEKKNFNHQISVRAKEIESKNKSLHDRIISEQKYKDRKKNYLEYWKQEKLKKDQFEQKKQFLQKIITNTRKIKGLKEELQNVQKRCEILLEDNQILSKEKSTLFVTI